MKQLIATVSSKGQITIPAELRQHLGVGEGDKVVFVLEDSGSVRMETPRYATLDALVGAAGSLGQALTWDQVRDIVGQDRAAKYAESQTSDAAADTDEGADE